MKILMIAMAATASLVVTSQASFYSTPQDFSGFGNNVLLDGSGWSSVGVIVTNNPGIAHSGTHAAYFNENAAATNSIGVATPNPARVWTDFRIRPALGTAPPDVPSTVQAFFYFNADSNITYRAGSAWVTATHDIFGAAAPKVDPDTWHRISIFQDYTTEIYAIMFDDVVIAQDIPFANSGTAYQSFFMNNMDGEALLDTIRVHNSLPGDLEQSLNHTETADAIELNTYGYVPRTLVVDDDFTEDTHLQFQEISGALAAWREHDRILVNDGEYAAITVTNDITLIGAGFTVASITVDNGATLTLDEDVEVTGTITVAANSAIVANNNITAANADVAGSINIGENTLTISGTLDLTGSGSIQIASGGTLSASNTITMAGNAEIVSTGGSLASSALNLSGIFTITASSWNATAAVAQELPFSDDFELYENGQAMSALGLFGWEADSSVVVSTATSASGSRSVMLPDGTQLELNINRGGAPRVWTDFYLQPALGEGPDAIEAAIGRGFAGFIDNQGDLNVVSNDTWVALNKTASWDNGSVAFTNSFDNTFSSNSFTRVSVYQNYENQTYSVFINDVHLVAHEKPFPESAASYARFIIENSGTDAFLDDILVTDDFDLLSFSGSPNINNNELDDRQEIHWYGNLTTFAGISGSIFRFR